MSDFRVPRIKVCGLTRTEDVVLAYTAGADAGGVVGFPPSPRAVTAARAAELVAELPFGAPMVAVLVDPPPAEALAWCRQAGVAALQLCGEEPASDFADFPLPMLRRLPVDAAAPASMEAWRSLAAAFLLDHPASAGGSGQTVDLALAAELVVRLAAPTPCLLAGGLSAENVAAAVEAVRPFGVDASSRLEAVPGQKDPEAVRAFVAEARRALSAFCS